MTPPPDEPTQAPTGPDAPRESPTIARTAHPTPQDFRRRYRDPEQPVVLQGAIDHWPAKTLWSPEYLCERFGQLPLAVESLEDDRGGDAEYFLSHVRRRTLDLQEYFDRARAEGADGRLYAAMQPLTGALAELERDLGSFPYLPSTLRRLARQKVYLWMGPAGCRAPLHIDPLHNFAVQLFGRKRWTLFPASQQPSLYLPSTLSSPHFSPVDVESPQLERFPRYADATPLVVDLEPGEILFVPSGWAHHVRSLSLSISVNLWWVRPHWRDLARVLRNRFM